MEKNSKVVDYKTIKHNLLERDNAFDNRFNTKKQTLKKHKKDKYKNYLDFEDNN